MLQLFTSLVHHSVYLFNQDLTIKDLYSEPFPILPWKMVFEETESFLWFILYFLVVLVTIYLCEIAHFRMASRLHLVGETVQNRILRYAFGVLFWKFRLQIAEIFLTKFILPVCSGRYGQFTYYVNSMCMVCVCSKFQTFYRVSQKMYLTLTLYFETVTTLMLGILGFPVSANLYFIWYLTRILWDSLIYTILKP